MNKNERIGILGLGIVGSRVAANLRKKGREVYVWSRSPKPVPNFLGSAEEVARACTILQFFVSDDAALLQTVQAISSALTKEHVLLFHPTVAPETIKKVGEIVTSLGAQFLDAPFTGSKVAAEKGLLVYYVGGDPELIRRMEPILLDSGRIVIPIGAIGQAATLKIAANMVIAGHLQVLGEALAVTAAAGIPIETVKEAFGANAFHSALMDMKLPTMIAGDFTPHFSAQHMMKDLRHARSLAQPTDIRTPAIDAALGSLEKAAAEGHLGDDFSILTRYAAKSGETAS